MCAYIPVSMIGNIVTGSYLSVGLTTLLTNRRFCELHLTPAVVLR